MPRTINQGFEEFHSKLTPNPLETEKSKKHRASIESCIKNNLGLYRFFRSGSFGNGTSISGYSDVDYFASVPESSISSNSNSTILKLKEILDNRFPNTGVKISSPAVVVPFSANPSETTEVVPAEFLEKTKLGHYVYNIPDGLGGWKKSSPDAHNAYVKSWNINYGYKIKPLVRFVKAWKYFNSIPVSSFYLEMAVTRYCSHEKSVVHWVDLCGFFKEIENLSAMQDPVGISGYIYPCKTQAQKDESLSKLQTAITRSYNGFILERDGKTKEAFEWFDKLFNYNFTDYYL